MNIEMSVDGADELADDLLDVPKEALPKFRKVVSKGALNIKRDLRNEAKSAGSYKHFYRSIDYDLHGDLEAEIGPDKDRIQGALGNILYFGTSKNAAVLDLNGPLDRETPKFERALGDVAEDIL